MEGTLLTILLSANTAAAFCGTYVGTADGSVLNRDSQVVVAVENGVTTLTLANDFDGAAADFGLVIPVPGDTTTADVTVTDRTALDTLDAYTAPRMVQYSCDDIFWIPGETGGWTDYGPSGSSSGCGGTGSSPEFSEQSTADSGSYAGGGLGSEQFGFSVEAERFTAGEYELALLDAEGVSGLSAWLGTNGYGLPEGAGSLVQEAIDGGARFLVAKVTAAELETERAWLSPIQIRYHGNDVVLPIRLGATASAGEQDILIYGITSMESGALAVSNYPSVAVESDCILGDYDGDGASDDLAAGYDGLFASTYTESEREGRAGWTLEFNSPQGVCDPLPPGGTIGSETLVALGFAAGVENAMLARIHLRGTPEELDQDLVLYESAYGDYWQQAYIQDNAQMRAYFPICGLGIDESVDACPEPDYDPPSYDDIDEVDDVTTDQADDADTGSCLCASTAFPPVVVLGLVALRRRRK